MLPLPSSLTLYAAAGTLVVGTIAGYKVADWKCEAAYAKALEQAQEQRERMQDALDEKSRDYEAARNQVDGLASSRRTDIRTIYRDVPAPPVSCAAPDSVIRVLESGVRRANAATTGKPFNDVSSTGQSTDPASGSGKSDMGKHTDSEVHGVLGETPTDD
jgi:hypothetical protein